MTTVTLQVAADEDDGYWATALFSYVTNLRLYIGGAGSANSGFYRFTGVSIPAGSTINSAIPALKGNGEGNPTPTMTVYADKQASSPRLTSDTDANGRTVTTASVGWNPTLTSGVFTDGPDIKTIVQELVDAYGASLDTIQLLHKYSGAASGNYEVAWSYYHAAGDAPKLTIDYTPPVTAGELEALQVATQQPYRQRARVIAY